MTNEPKKSTRPHNIFMWWRVDEAELQMQLTEYKTLSWGKSARQTSAALLIFSAIVTFGFMTFSNVNGSAILDVVLFLLLAQFTYSGHRWAFTAAMLIWTFEKGYLLYSSFGSNNFGGPVMQILWWAIYMKVFYLGWRVETERMKPPPPEEQRNEGHDSKSGACPSCS